MELKDAYKKALMQEIQPLIDAGKCTLLCTIEELVEDLAEAFFKGMRAGAVLSEDKWDDVVVPPAAGFLESRLAPYVNKIDDQEG